MVDENSVARDRRRAALISLYVGVAMLGGKWFAYLITSSHAILSDALESIVHVAATVFALVSIILSSRPPDPKYPYGYGKISYFSAGFEGGLIALAALAIFYESIQGLIEGQKLARLDLGLWIIVAASVANLVLGFYLVREGKKSDSLILIADGQHVLSDAYTSIGVVVGVGLVLFTGYVWLDNVVAMAVALNILWTGYHLVREGFRGLMDRADPELLGRIVDSLYSQRDTDWIDLHQLRAWQSGDKTFVDFHLVVPQEWTVQKIHDTIHDCESILRKVTGEETEVIIHFDPEKPGRYDRNRVWTVEHATNAPEHTRTERHEAIQGISVTNTVDGFPGPILTD